MAAPAATVPTATTARSLAAELFVLGFPLALTDAVRRTHPLVTGRFHKLPADPGALAHGLIDHDAHTVQSSAILDLTDGPVLLHLPDVRGRYYSVTLVDSAGESFASLGSRSHDPGTSDIALAGPRWHGEVKRGFRARRAHSDMVWAVSRIWANSVADVAAVEALAARQWAAPLLTASDPSAPAALPTLEAGDLPLAQQLAEMSPEVFFHRLALLAERAPAEVAANLTPAVAAGLERLGGLDPDGWADGVQQALMRGFNDGLSAITKAAGLAAEVDAAGWSGFERTLEATPLGRAVRAYASLGAPLAEDVLTLSCASDESGRPLSGEERYRIHFATGGLPPTEAVWRLTALPLGELTGLPGPHRGIGDRSDLVFNRDGSLELIIQSDPPEAGREVNWLQAPPGPFRLEARLYWPAPTALSGAWRMPPVERLGSRFARRTRGRAPIRRAPHSPFGPRDLSAAYPSWRTPS